MSGGKSSPQIVGYQYFIGMHTVAAMAPVDGCSEIAFADRSAWKGPAGNSQIEINAYSLFGDKEREGGVAGYVDYLDGEPTQSYNEYLRQVLFHGDYQVSRTAFQSSSHNPGLVPNFRSVAGHVFRKFYWGNNPYLKQMRQKWHNLFSTFPDSGFYGSPNNLDSKGSWNRQYALICPEYDASDRSIYVAYDNTGSFSSPTDKAINRDIAMLNWLDTLTNVSGKTSLRIQEFRNAAVGASFERIPFTAADIPAAKAFIEGLGVPSGLTSWADAFSTAPQFFIDAETALLGSATTQPYPAALTGNPNWRIMDFGVTAKIPRIVLFLSDGSPTVGDWYDGDAILQTIDDVQVYSIAFDILGDMPQVDNTPSDGVPLIDSSNPGQIQFALSQPFISHGDLNAAHLLRNILIDPRHGGSGDPNEIGTSFDTAAALFFNEGMGLSFEFQTPSDRDNIRRLVEQHCAAVTYFSRSTGKWEINPIRPDYTVGSLFTFDDTNIVEWISHDKPWQQELPNHITLEYTRRENGEPKSISDTNSAALQITGKIIPDVVKLEGITCDALATKVLQRELNARTNSWRSGQIRVSYIPEDLEIGDPFIINEPRLGINSEVMRLDDVEETDGVDNTILVKFSQDVHQYDIVNTTIPVSVDQATTGTVSQTAQPSSTIFFEEASYYDQVFNRGQANIDTALTTDPDFGNWHITGNAFNSAHTSGDIFRDDTSGWTQAGTAILMPIWTIDEVLSRNPSTGIGDTFTATVTGREIELRAGQIIQINAERMRLDSVSVSGTTATFTVGRGILDTVPVEHAAGSIVMAWEYNSASDNLDYTGGDVVDVRLLPKTTSNRLDINSATTQTLYMDSRAIRPYPVGQLKVDGEYVVTTTKSGNVTVTWVHRDRLLQTSTTILDHTDAGIGPETGAELFLVRQWLESTSAGEVAGHEIETALSPDNLTTTTVDVDAADMLAYKTANSTAMNIGIRVKRTVNATVYANFQTPFVRTPVQSVLAAPFNLTGEAV